MTGPRRTPELDDTMAAPSVRASLSPLSAEPTPERLAGRYTLLSLLGSGAMGTVYRAHDLMLDEVVALKVLREELAGDASMLARFRQEAKLARKVTHANVARTFDIGEHGPHRFLTMELVEGLSLAEHLAHEPRLPLERVVGIGKAIAAGLAAAHAAGVVHRDLKPANVLLGNDGRVVITDFGIACAVERPSTDRTQGTVGTPAYMAPEQVEGARDVDARADVYALGAMLFELWTGAAPWQGDSVFVVAARRLTEPPPDPRRARPDLPEAVARLTMRCMARARGDRFANGAEVTLAIAQLSLAEPSAPPPAVAVPAPSVKAVAVLPFRNTGVPEDDYLVEGLTDDLIDTLSMTTGLRVCARGLVAGPAASGKDARGIGAELGVDVVVDGSLARTANGLRASARVISVADGFQLWAKRLDRPSDAFFEVSDAMAQAVAGALTRSVEPPPRDPHTDAHAHDLYLRARHEYHKFWSDNVRKAVELFEQALALSPDDPTILAAYAIAMARRCNFDDGTPAHAESARRAADRALVLVPGHGAAKTARAYQQLLAGDTMAAAKDLREVLTAFPDAVDALDVSGRLLGEAGALDEGIRRLARAVMLEPTLASARLELARLHALRGDREASEASFGDEPADPGLASLYWVNRVRVAIWQRDVERARLWKSRVDARGNVFPAVRVMFDALLATPTPEVIRATIVRMSVPTALLRRRAYQALLAAEFAQFLGEPELALDALEQVAEAQSFDVTWFDRSPTLAPLRGHPRFARARADVASRAAEVRGALGL